MSKYLDFIGQKISSPKGSQNEDLEISEESGVVAQVKKHGLKVAGGLAVVAGSVFAYKHFSKSKVGDKTDADAYFEESMLLEQDEKPTAKIHDFVSKQDAEKEGRGQEFEASMAELDANSPSMEDLMEFDDSLDEIPPMDSLEKMRSEIAFQEITPEISSRTPDSQKSDSLEDIFGIEFSPEIAEEKDDDKEGSSAIDLPGADLFGGASLKEPSMIPNVPGKFTG